MRLHRANAIVVSTVNTTVCTVEKLSYVPHHTTNFYSRQDGQTFPVRELEKDVVTFCWQSARAGRRKPPGEFSTSKTGGLTPRRSCTMFSEFCS